MLAPVQPPPASLTGTKMNERCRKINLQWDERGENAKKNTGRMNFYEAPGLVRSITN